MLGRLKGWALLNDNTSITAPWIGTDAQALYQANGFVVNNITMAMPHPGVVSAASDPANNILQPDELNGLGIYSIRASVLVPFVNVVCALGMPADALKPLIYSMWSDANKTVTPTYEKMLGHDHSHLTNVYLNGTPFDNIFQWGPTWGDSNWPPIFPQLPIDYNTIVNDTTHMPYGRDSIYILGKGGAVDATGQPSDRNYALCQLRVGQTPQCSTQYNASSNVGALEAICNEPNDTVRYSYSKPNETISVSRDWPNVASMWARSMFRYGPSVNGTD